MLQATMGLILWASLWRLGHSRKQVHPSSLAMPPNHWLQEAAREHEHFCGLSTAILDICLQASCAVVSIPSSQDSSLEVQPFEIVVYSENDIVSNFLRDEKMWEQSHIHEMIYALEKNPDGIVVDVGGNLGWYSLYAAALVRSKSMCASQNSHTRPLMENGMQGRQVVAFEPLSNNVIRFRSSMCRNHGFGEKISLVTHALGPRIANNCSMYAPVANIGDGMMNCEADFKLPDNHLVLPFPRSMVTLDAVLGDLGEEIAFLKMDVEGFESRVVEGARDLLQARKVPFILMEYSPFSLAQQSQDKEAGPKLLHSFERNGYELSLAGFKSFERHHPQTIHDNLIQTCSDPNLCLTVVYMVLRQRS